MGHVCLALIALWAFAGGSITKETQKTVSQEEPVASLHDAARLGDLEAIRHHAGVGADLDARDPIARSTALIMAATFGQSEAVKVLIEAGAELDLVNSYGSTALHVAALLCHGEVVQKLLDGGADKTIRDGSGFTAHDLVSSPFEQARVMYDVMGAALKPAGLELDYARLEAARPEIAKMLE